MFEQINTIFFIIFSVILVFTTILTIMCRKMIHSILWSMITFLMVGFLFLLLGAVFNATVQFLVYVVGIPVLIALSIMFIGNKKRYITNLINKKVTLGFLGAFTLTFGLSEFIHKNKDIFQHLDTCNIYTNSYTNLISISKNILGVYPMLLIGLGLGILCLIIGVSHYDSD